jgi:HSP20 family protein
MDRLNANFDQPGLLRGHATSTDFPVEISETESEIQLKASLPGVAPEDIDISVHAHSLTIKAASKEEAEEKGKNYLRREMSYGAMQRSFALPTEISVDKAEATFRNGVLRLTLPKAKTTSATQIKVT